MTIPQLKLILDIFIKNPSDIPNESIVKGYVNQSMVIGINSSVTMILGMEAWRLALPHLQGAINDIPESENNEIYAQILNAAEVIWPNFISAVAKNNKKKTHVMGMLTRMVKEIRDAPTN